AVHTYEAAVHLLQLATKLSPAMALAQFALGKAIVLRAEWQQLCAASQMQASSPAEVSASASLASARAAFSAARSQAPLAAARSQIENWLARASLRFGAAPAEDALPHGFPSNAGEAAALVYAGRT